MSQLEKLLEQFSNTPFPKWSEVLTLMKKLGYVKNERRGSRLEFWHEEKNSSIYCTSHIGNTIKTYTKKDIIEKLKKAGLLMKYFEYNGYLGSCKVSIEDNCLHGKIEFISDLVNYEAQTTEELRKEFELAVDDYLSHCKEVGKSPDKTLRAHSTLESVRVTPKSNQKSRNMGKTLNDYIKDVFKKIPSRTLKYSDEIQP